MNDSGGEWESDREGEALAWRPNRFEIDLGAIAHNAGEVRRIVGLSTQIFAALKADGYGFGVSEVADAVVAAGLDGLAMVEVKDAIQLRRRGIGVPILLYGGVPADRETAELVERYDLMPTLFDCESAKTYSVSARRGVRAFVKVDVGTERLGVRPEEAIAFIKTVGSLDRVRVHGVYTHLHVPEGREAEAYVAWQFVRFTGILQELANESIAIPIKMAASTAVLRISEGMKLNAVDPGHMLFGLMPPGPGKVPMDLRPAFHALKSQLIQVKGVSRSEFRSQVPFGLRENMRLGVIPIGLTDGMAVLNCGQVLVKGKRVSILGKPSLEHTRVDLTDVPDAETGDEVVVIGAQGGQRITADEVVGYQKGIAAVELALAVRRSVRRVYFNYNN